MMPVPNNVVPREEADTARDDEQHDDYVHIDMTAEGSQGREGLAQVIAANIVGKAYDKYSDSEELGEKIENGKRMYLTKRVPERRDSPVARGYRQHEQQRSAQYQYNEA